MADYTVYNNHYQYMEMLLKQIQSMSQKLMSEYGISGDKSLASSAKSDFKGALKEAGSKVMEGVASKIEVPESMDAIFDEAAALFDVPANLLKAIGKAESGFDANAVSYVGASGVMQLMPATAEMLGVTDVFDARSNIMGGAKYISDKLKEYDGDIDLALAAYNAGSGNVAKYGGVPPFPETQNYIRKIREYMGEEISTGQTVYSERSAVPVSAGAAEPAGTDGNTGAQRTADGFVRNSLYMTELMRLQMQNQMMAASQSVTSGEDRV